MNSRELFERVNELYGDIAMNFRDIEQMENEIHAKVTMYFIDNPSDRVKISRSEYRRLRDGWPHTWSPWDHIEGVMVKKKMTRYIKWVK